MSDSDKPVRQDVLREQIQKVIDIHSHHAMFTTFSVILVVIGYLSIRHLQNPGVGNSYPVSIASDILQYLIYTFSGWSGIYNPVFVKTPLSGTSINVYTNLFKPFSQQGHECSSESWAHCRYREEEVTALTSFELMPHTRFINPTTGHNAVKVRVIEKIGTPCMEDGCHAGADSLTFCKGVKSSPSRLEHAVVEDGLMSHGDRMQACRYREDNVEVLGRDNLLPAEGNPLFAFFVLALGTMPVSATVVTNLHLAALRTNLHVAAKRFCPAKRHVTKSLSDRCNNLMRIEKLSSMIMDNLTNVKSCPHLLEGREC